MICFNIVHFCGKCGEFFFSSLSSFEMREGLTKHHKCCKRRNDDIERNEASVVLRADDEVAEHTHCDYSTVFFSSVVPFLIFIHSKRSTALNSSWTLCWIIFFRFVIRINELNFFFFSLNQVIVVLACLSSTIKSCRALIAAVYLHAKEW